MHNSGNTLRTLIEARTNLSEAMISAVAGGSNDLNAFNFTRQKYEIG